MAQGEVEYRNVKIEVNGERIILLDAQEEQQKSIVVDGRSYVPIDCFIHAVGGEMTYDEAENQISITLAADAGSASSGDSEADDGAYTDDKIASVLPSGRWTCTNETGTSFFDFSADNTGKITGFLDCTWMVSNGVVCVDFISQGQQWHREFTFTQLNGTLQLVNEANPAETYTLDGAVDGLANIIGTWHVPGANSTQLILNADASFQLKVGGLTYVGTWAADSAHVYLTQNGSSITGNYNGTSIVLNIGGQLFTFTR